MKVPPTTLNKLHVIALLLLSIFSPRVYAVSSPSSPIVPIPAKNLATVKIQPIPTVYSQAEIDQMTQNTFHPYILRTLIKCESQNTNIARMDSNGLMSYGILQFNGSATWEEYAPRAGVISSTPMKPISAIKVADFMLSVGQIGRWTCARLTGLI